MKRTTVTINRQRFAVPLNIDVPALKSAIEDAIDRGGGFIDIPARPSRTLSVFVTPGLPITIDEEEFEEVDPAEDGLGPGSSTEFSAASYWPSDQLDIDLEV